MADFSYLPDMLRAVRDHKLEINGQNIWRASRHKSLIQMIDGNGSVLVGLPQPDKVASFRLSQRGNEELKKIGDASTAKLPFNKHDPPMNIRLWLSSFRRWCRNCPKGLALAYSDGELHVLATDTEEKVKNDDLHRLGSMKINWVK